ncbi:MAG: hypothetical protein KBF89_02460 [Acidimicrobiia bacterium]|nr:hypothetical protein [Acidimicrobiia bacterium]
MQNPPRRSEIATHLTAVLLFTIATVGSARSVLHGWIALAYIPAYAIGFIAVLVTSIIIFARDPFFRFKKLLLVFAIIFVVSAFVIQGDNGDVSGTYYQEKEYSAYNHVDYDGLPVAPYIPRKFSDAGHVLFFGSGIANMTLMIVFASSKRRKSIMI